MQVSARTRTAICVGVGWGFSLVSIWAAIRGSDTTAMVLAACAGWFAYQTCDLLLRRWDSLNSRTLDQA
jgi:hypothetical protein